MGVIEQLNLVRHHHNMSEEQQKKQGGGGILGGVTDTVGNTVGGVTDTVGGATEGVRSSYVFFPFFVSWSPPFSEVHPVTQHNHFVFVLGRPDNDTARGRGRGQEQGI